MITRQVGCNIRYQVIREKEVVRYSHYIPSKSSLSNETVAFESTLHSHTCLFIVNSLFLNPQLAF